MNFINKDQRQRQDYLDMLDRKAIRIEEHRVIVLGCVACMLTIVMLVSIGCL
jgi:hypothetical protein